MNKKKKYILLGSSVVVIVLLVNLFIFIGKGNKIDSPIKKVITGINNNKVDYIIDAYHDYCKEDMQTKFSQNSLDVYQDFLEENNGENVKFSYKVTDSQKMSAEDLDMYYTVALAQYPYIQNHKLTFDAVYTVSTEMVLKNKETRDEADLEWLIVKIDGKYYLLDEQYNTFINQFMEW